VDITLNKGYPDFVGLRTLYCGSGAGPTSYTTGGEALNIATFQYHVDSVDSCASVSGTYWGIGIPNATGPRATWKLLLFVTATGAQVGSGVNLSAEKFVVSGKGGLN
jgi:hypothetical protein